MRVMTFPQWFELLQSVFESLLFFLQRIKVRDSSHTHAADGFHLCALLQKKKNVLLSFQATLNVIRNVVLEVLASNQKNRLQEEACSGHKVQEASPGPSLLQGEAELAYLTHEGLFISDALNEAQQQQQQLQDQSAAVGSRIQPSRTEQTGSDSVSATTETSVSSFM